MNEVIPISGREADGQCFNDPSHSLGCIHLRHHKMLKIHSSMLGIGIECGHFGGVMTKVDEGTECILKCHTSGIL